MTQKRSLAQHLSGKGPKRILAVDGGGLRGLIALCFLEKIEDMLREKSGRDDDFRLSDYFDLIGGTSTGAIIAGYLATGGKVRELMTLYEQLGHSVFKDPSSLRLLLYGAKFSSKELDKILRTKLAGVRLGDDSIKTGVGIIAKRLDTGSPWMIHNNPKGKYYHSPDDQPNAIPNKNFLLWKIIRASAAAPSYFKPELFEVSEKTTGAFVDGGMSPYNNPSLALFQMATLSAHGFNWQTGADNLLMVSVGTGFPVVKADSEKISKLGASRLALRCLASLAGDCDTLTQTMMQWMSSSPTSWIIDSEIGSLENDSLGGMEWLTYLRYNLCLDKAWIKTHLGVSITAREEKALIAIDKPQNMEKLIELGRKAAEKQFREDHFPERFDL